MVDTEGSIDPNYHLPVSEAPIINRKIPMSSFDFDSMFESGVISSAKIRRAQIGTAQIGTISFNQVNGGTATLGGTTNGNGLLTVKTSAGVEVVRLDNTGITITAGSISNVQIGTVNWTSGTIVSALIGTSQITGGTATSVTVNTPTIGTPTLTGGTVNPLMYKINGTTGATGTILYLNSGTAVGTIIVQSGLIVSIT